ncbi:zona pellucida sperm-binding protein 2 [Oreochromis niloticus]|uniref:zona pellucida sperm-binding protein 2 n=1 Tax=Oreochromis niloticus TaxID=8128 RepID=UPI0006746616|nr:zona pellucida sperm-binding protein 2 [Oreochromis niloticus]
MAMYVYVAERGQPVYVELFAVKHEDRDLVLLLEDSWATLTEDSDGPQRWKLLLVTATKQLCCKFPIAYRTRMILHSQLVYFHCNVEICKGPECLQPCSSWKSTFRPFIFCLINLKITLISHVNM